MCDEDLTFVFSFIIIIILYVGDLIRTAINCAVGRPEPFYRVVDTGH